ncbi:MAG: F0F1 ATP synthase subunit B [Pseudomonadota bacterium]|nr:F0F1 ATP synthase subunit B [Pseudomonadota bacterium]
MFNAEFFVALSFLIFVGLAIYLGLPRAVISSLDKRSKDIEDELDEARNLREEAQKILAKEKKALDKADKEIEILIKKANKQVEELTKKAEENLKQDIERKKQSAEFKIEQAKIEAINDVRRKVSDLSSQITEKYLKENLDAKASKTLIDESISEIKKNI